MTKLVFLWHMHQPYYKDTTRDLYLMPWVRLHCLKGYYDIPASIEKYGVKGVVNMVPSLIEQIVDYAVNGASDAWLDHTIPNPYDMKEEEKAFVIRNFFMINWERLVKPSPRYHEILNKRIRYEKKLNWSEMAKLFSNEEIFDLQVLFNLKWFGFMAREKYPRLKELDEKDRAFSQKDKEDLLDIQKKVLGEIIPLYRRLAEAGVIELSFTPFYHPIFPLIHDSSIASRSSGAPLPERFSYPEDAKWHIEEGKSYASKTWGMEITGMWPAEGSVSPEILEPALNAGVKWIATDEGILLNSLGTQSKAAVLYRPYRLKLNEEKHITGFFRDKYLSDLLGFSFSRMEPDRAVDIFMNYVRSVTFNLPNGHPEPVVSVILDGENAWESYPGNGEFFLKELFSRLSINKEIKTTTFGEITDTEDHDLMQPISRLFSGSWINSNYDIWIGNDEDNEAWVYLKRVRDF
ncbi:MAG TPA: glycoside hydrolase family 57 protein, partial [bacterium]|nr:glycoside hydrolase family 57 protein [bacterium]